MRKLASLCLVCSLLVFIGCSTVSITSNYDRFEEFTWYKTFTLNDGENLPDNTLNKYPQLKEYIDEVVREILVAKGFTYKETGDTDFVVYPYGVLTEVRQNFRATSGANWGGSVILRGPAVELTQGSLVIDVVNTMDKENKKLTWRGRGVRLVDEITDTENQRKRLQKNITKILADFPPN